MIRSQIPLSLPPVPPAHTQKKKKRIWRHTWRRGRPAAVNGPTVRVHLGGGGRAGVDYQSLRLEEPTLALQFSPDGREVFGLHRASSAARRFLSNFLKTLQISCLTVQRQQSHMKGGGKKKRDPEGSHLTRSFSNIRNDQ